MKHRDHMALLGGAALIWFALSHFRTENRVPFFLKMLQ
jgi:hypothetical protein